jgi:hypothetical protein
MRARYIVPLRQWRVTVPRVTGEEGEKRRARNLLPYLATRRRSTRGRKTPPRWRRYEKRARHAVPLRSGAGRQKCA